MINMRTGAGILAVAQEQDNDVETFGEAFCELFKNVTTATPVLRTAARTGD